MYEAPVITAQEEKDLLQEWFDTVHFDVEDEGIPPLAPEDDDEEPQSTEDRSAPIVVNDLSTLDFDALMEELRNREPDNPF